MTQVQRQGIWQSTFVPLDDAARPKGAAPEVTTEQAGEHGVGWSRYEMFREETGPLAPRVVMHDGRVFIVYSNKHTHGLSARAYTPGTGWEDLGHLSDVHSVHPPALVSHSGTLHAFIRSAGSTRLEYATYGADHKWTAHQLHSPDKSGVTQVNTAVTPGTASHGGELHLAYFGADYAGRMRHAVVRNNTLAEEFSFPADAEPDSRLSLVSYQGALHLIYTFQDRLRHWIKPDGGAWTQAPDGPATGTKQYAAGSTVFDDRIYTAYLVQDVTRRPLDEEWDELFLQVYGADQVLRREGEPDRAVNAQEFRAAVAAQDWKYLEAVLRAVTMAEASGDRVRAAIKALQELADDASTAELAKDLRAREIANITRVAKGEKGPKIAKIAQRMLAEELARDAEYAEYMKNAKAPVADVLETSVQRVGYQVYDGTTWSGEVMLPVHANMPPSLVAYQEPDDPARGRLMLVYGGVGGWTPPPTPPPPPPAPVGPELTARRVRREGIVAEGEGGYSKLNYFLEARVFHNPDRRAYHVKATWYFDLWALNSLGIAWRDRGYVSGGLKLVQTVSPHARVAEHSFNIESLDGRGTIEATWEVPPGQYEVTLANARKTGGYHFPHRGDAHRYSTVETGWETIIIQVGK